MNPAKARQHRRQQAEKRFPLLRQCPNTAAIGLISYLDRLSADEHLSFADQLSDFADAQLINAASTHEQRIEHLGSLPLVNRHFGKHFGATSPSVPFLDVRLIPVKVLSGVLKDEVTGGFDGWAKLVPLSEDPDARAPPRAHASSLQEIVPISPVRLRKLIGEVMKTKFGASPQRIDTEHTRFEARMTGSIVVVDVLFSRGGGARHQIDYYVSAQIEEAAPIRNANYESVWLISGRWDYVTQTNADRSVAHLARQIETCLELA